MSELMTTVLNTKIEVTFKVAKNREAKDNGQIHTFKAVVDFTGMTVEDVLKAAVQSHVISQQGAIRRLEEVSIRKMADKTSDTPLVIVASEPGKVNDPEKAMSDMQKLWSQLTDEQRAILTAKAG